MFLFAPSHLAFHLGHCMGSFSDQIISTLLTPVGKLFFFFFSSRSEHSDCILKLTILFHHIAPRTEKSMWNVTDIISNSFHETLQGAFTTLKLQLYSVDRNLTKQWKRMAYFFGVLLWYSVSEQLGRFFVILRPSVISHLKLQWAIWSGIFSAWYSVVCH